MLYKKVGLKLIIFSKYTTNLKTTISQRSLKKLRFASINLTQLSLDSNIK